MQPLVPKPPNSSKFQSAGILCFKGGNRIPLASICIRSFMRSSSSPSRPCFARSFRSSCRFGWFLLVTSRSHRPNSLAHPPPTLPFCVGVRKASDLLQNELVPCRLRLFCCSAMLQDSAFLLGSFLAKQLTKSAPISAPLEKIPPPTRMAKDTWGAGICSQKLGSRCLRKEYLERQAAMEAPDPKPESARVSLQELSHAAPLRHAVITVRDFETNNKLD